MTAETKRTDDKTGMPSGTDEGSATAGHMPEPGQSETTAKPAPTPDASAGTDATARDKDETVGNFAAEEGLYPEASPAGSTDGTSATAQAVSSESPSTDETTSGAGDSVEAGASNGAISAKTLHDAAPPPPQTDPKLDDPSRPMSDTEISAAAAEAGLVSDGTVSAAGTENRGRSDWSKTGGYSGPPAITRAPDPRPAPTTAKTDEDPATGVVGTSGTRATSGSAGSPTHGSGSTTPGSATSASQRRDEPKSGVGFGGALAAGLLGAIIALGGAAALYSAGYLPLTPSASEEAPADTTEADIETLRNEVAALREELGSVTAASPGEGAAAPQGLSEEDAAALTQRVDALEAAGADSDELATAVQAASDGATAAQARADETAGELASLREALTATQSAVEAAADAAEQAQQTGSGAQDTANAAESAAENAQSSVDRLRSDYETARTETDDRLATVEEANRNARVALAAAGLKGAVDTGAAFEGELEAYQTAGGSESLMGSLQPFAGEGVPNALQLASAWPDTESEVAAALAGPGADAPLGDQMLAGLSGLVQTRPAGEVAADASGDDAQLARLNQAITSGDLQEFQSQWQTLPDDAQEAGADFYADVEARLAADKALSDAIASAISGSAPAESADQTNQG